MSDGAAVFVFGAGGRIGKELVSSLSRAGIPVVGCTRKEADITDEGAVARLLAQTRPYVIVNAAGYSDVDNAELERERAQADNARGPAVLSTQSGYEGIPLVHLSSAYVFSGKKGEPYREDDPVMPISVYGLTKAAGEDAVRSGNPRHIVLRTSGVYGPSIPSFSWTVLRQADAGHSVSAATDLRGSPTSIGLLSAAIASLAAAIRHGSIKWGTYHLAGSGSASRYELARTTLRSRENIVGVSAKLLPAAAADFSPRARRPPNSTLDSGLFAKTFSFETRPWDEAIYTLVEHYYRSGFEMRLPRSRRR
ncbi:MAG TPA: dTDP-4-dehydrorhamnose reductase [Rhizomicrobium sp.]|nr:dTDP-4-dehydrorhamnose reductase [Rhizomicrobium sp.]